MIACLCKQMKFIDQNNLKERTRRRKNNESELKCQEATQQHITYFLTLAGLALFTGNVFDFNAEGFLSMLEIFFAVF